MKNADGTASVGNIRARFENANNTENVKQTEKKPAGVGNLKARFEHGEAKPQAKAAIPPKPKGVTIPKDTNPVKPTPAVKPPTQPNNTSSRTPVKHATRQTSNNPPFKKELSVPENSTKPPPLKPSANKPKPGKLNKPGAPFNKPVQDSKAAEKVTSPVTSPGSPKVDIKSLASKLENQLKMTGSRAEESPVTNGMNQTRHESPPKAPKDIDPPLPEAPRLSEDWSAWLGDEEDFPPPPPPIDPNSQKRPLPSKPNGHNSMNAFQPRPTKDLPKPPGKELPKPPGKELPKPPGKELPKPPTKELPKPPAKELPKPPTKELPTPPTKELPTPPTKELPKLPIRDLPLPPLPTTTKNTRELPPVEPMFQNKTLPPNVMWSSKDLLLQQFRVPSDSPPGAPGRHPEMISRRPEVLGPDFHGLSDNLAEEDDEVYDDIETSPAGAVRPMTVIMPMTEEEEEELEKEKRGVGRPPSDIYDETLDPRDFETDDIYEDV